jgi:hypothetical protein
VELLKQLCEAVVKERPELLSNFWILHHEIALPTKVLSVNILLAQKSIIKMEQPPCSLNLLPNHFWMCPKIKSALKGLRFLDTEDIQKM